MTEWPEADRLTLATRSIVRINTLACCASFKVVETEKCNNLFLCLTKSHSICNTCICGVMSVDSLTVRPLFELLAVLMLQDKPGIFFWTAWSPLCLVSANELHSCSEETKRGDIEMYVSLPPGCYASAVMCEEHTIVPFFFNLKSFIFGRIFFSLLLSTLLDAVPVSSISFVCLLVCLFVCLYQREAKYLFTFSSRNKWNKYDWHLQNDYVTVRLLR
jgi:hypothetical protein